MKFTIFMTMAMVAATFTCGYGTPIKSEENYKDIEPGVMENLEGMFKSYDDDEVSLDDEFDYDLDGANTHNLGYYRLESEPIKLPKHNKPGLFDKLPKFDLFDKFHKDEYEPQIQPIYVADDYRKKHKLPKFDLFDKFHKNEYTPQIQPIFVDDGHYNKYQLPKFDLFDKFHKDTPQIQPIYVDAGQYNKHKFPKFDLFDKFHKDTPQVQPIYFDNGHYNKHKVPKFDLFDKFHKDTPQVQPIYFDNIPKFDLFDKFHKVEYTPQFQPIYDFGHYSQQADIVAVPVKLKKCGLFDCKFDKKLH